MEDLISLYHQFATVDDGFNDTSKADVYRAADLPVLKEFMRTAFYSTYAEVADSKSQAAALAFSQQIMGTAEQQSLDKAASQLAQEYLSDFCSKVYVEQYFDKSSIEQVVPMVDEIVSVYKDRIRNLDWMQEATKQETVKKLDQLGLKIGFPSEWPSYMEKIKLKSPEEGGSLINNIFEISRILKDDHFASKDRLLSQSKWVSPVFTVNAFYNPSENTIYLPGSILQAPFFDKNASLEENLSGIGTFIGHEITHAFDNIGAQYDENGNMRNWWEASDYEKFQQLQQVVVDYYNQYENIGMRVDGEQTLDENIADLGILSALTEIAKAQNLDLKKLYRQYATIWAFKATPEMEQSLMMSEPHSPAKVRVNAVLSSLPEFYTLFGVKSGNGMYQPEGKRPMSGKHIESAHPMIWGGRILDQAGKAIILSLYKITPLLCKEF